MTLPVELLRADRKLVERYRDRWRWIFVDEYQDVDEVQYELLRLLSPADGNLCAIGDPDQAIYSFRGADVGYFLRFSEDFTDARLVRLTRNYRSSAPILAAAVQAIAPSSLVRGRRLDPARLDPEAPLVGRYPAASVADEADFVVRTVDELVGGLSHRSLDSGRIDGRSTTLSFSDIAVLYRTDAQAAPIVDALSRAGIPVQKRSHDRLRDRPGVAAIARELRHADGLGGSLAARVRLAGQVLAERFAAPTLDAAGSVGARGHLGGRRPADPAGPALRRRPGRASCRSWPPARRWTRSTRAPRRSPCSPCTPRRAWSSRWSSWSAARTGCCRCAGRARRRRRGRIAEERRLFFVGLTRAQDRLYVSHAARRTPARHRAGLCPVAVPRRDRPGPVRTVRRSRAAPPEGPPAPPDLSRRRAAARPAAPRRSCTFGGLVRGMHLMSPQKPQDRRGRGGGEAGAGRVGGLRRGGRPSQAPASRAGPRGSRVFRRTRRAASRPSTRAAVQHVRQEQPGQQGVHPQPAERQAEDGGEFHVPEAQPGAGQQGQQHVRRARDRRTSQRAEQPAGSAGQQRRSGQTPEGQQPGDEDQRVGQPQAGQVDPRQHQTDRRDREEDRQRRVVTHCDGKADKDTGRHHRVDPGPSDPLRPRKRPWPGVRRGEAPRHLGYDEADQRTEQRDRHQRGGRHGPDVTGGHAPALSPDRDPVPARRGRSVVTTRATPATMTAPPSSTCGVIGSATSSAPSATATAGFT